MKLKDTNSFKAAKTTAGVSWLVNGVLGTIFMGLGIGCVKKMGRAEGYNATIDALGNQEVPENFDEEAEKAKHN